MDTVQTALLPPPGAEVRSNATESPPSSGDEGGGFKPFGDDGLTFFDLLDVVNPLQHIPVVATLYGEWTGDGIDPVPRVAGGGLFGGLIGLAVSVANVVIEESTGRDVGEHAMALITGEDGDSTETVTAAAAKPWVNPDDRPQTLGPSPVSQHLEVLEWARAEVAAVSGPPASVADHSDVLAWARGEAAFAADAAAAAGLAAAQPVGRYRDAVMLAEARQPQLDIRE